MDNLEHDQLLLQLNMIVNEVFSKDVKLDTFVRGEQENNNITPPPNNINGQYTEQLQDFPPHQV